MRKYEAIDLMALYSTRSYVAWNTMLTKNLREMNINGLAKVRYQIQAGMDDLAKKKLTNEDIIVWYLRLMRSIEKTAKQILRIKHPMPGDNPLVAKKYPDRLSAKRARDQEFQKFLHTSSY